MKNLYSPFVLAFQSSHENLNPYHRISGRIIYFLLALHGAFYINYFVQAGVLLVRVTSLVPLLGIFALLLLTGLTTTSLAIVRRWSYRIFFVLHLTIAVSILPILFFHATPLRLYTVESLVVFLLDIVARKLDTVTAFSKITLEPHTKLLKLTIPIPATKIRRFEASPGQHVYLNIPPESTPYSKAGPSIHNLLYNPFTVADVASSEITLVLRALHGPTTTALKQLTKLSKAKPPMNIEGPYGGARHFPHLAEFDRVLLVAGGVGGTFILPIFHQVVASTAAEGLSPSRIQLIWSMRSVAEAHWAIKPENKSVFDEEELVKIYLSGTASVGTGIREEPEDGSVDMSDISKREEFIKVSGGHTRPDLRKIVDETFRHGEEERVAVLVLSLIHI